MSDRVCSVDGCTRPLVARLLCDFHYRQAKARGEFATDLRYGKRPKDQCLIEGCARTAHSRGWCTLHYQRWRRNGNPLVTSRSYGAKRNVARNGYVRVWAPEHPCAMSDGYAWEHRVLWHDANGPIPDGFHVHHINHDRLDNRLENLELISASEHAKRHAVERMSAHGGSVAVARITGHGAGEEG